MALVKTPHNCMIYNDIKLIFIIPFCKTRFYKRQLEIVTGHKLEI